MSTQNDGGPAFPQHGFTTNPEVLERMKNQGGMTLRDWFAGQETLTDWDHPETFISKEAAEKLAGRPRPSTGNYVETLQFDADWRAALKYIRADAMLKARQQ